MYAAFVDMFLVPPPWVKILVTPVHAVSQSHVTRYCLLFKRNTAVIYCYANIKLFVNSIPARRTTAPENYISPLRSFDILAP